MVGIVKIKIKEQNVSKCMDKFVKGWMVVYDYNEVDNSKIWVIW